MKTLADEIAMTVNEAAQTVTLTSLARLVGERKPETRMACAKAHSDGQIIFFRRGRGGAWHAAKPDSGIRRCVICAFEFEAVRKETRTCSYSCSRHLAYQNEGTRERHKASAKAAGARPSRRERMREISRALASDPAEIARRSECNRKSWADPVQRTKRIISIKDAWSGPKAESRRSKAREKKLSLWSDPEWKARTVAAMRTGRRGRFKRAVIELANQTPRLTENEIAARLELSVERVKLLMRRAHKTGELDRKPADGRKRKQSAQEVKHRVERTKLTK